MMCLINANGAPNFAAAQDFQDNITVVKYIVACYVAAKAGQTANY